MDKIKADILKSDYQTAYKRSIGINFKVLSAGLIDLCSEENEDVYTSNTMAVYSFLLHSIFQSETAELHNLITDITVIYPEKFLIGEGVTQIGFNHMKKACELAPENIQYKKWLLLFYDEVPGEKGTYLSESEADEVRAEIDELELKNRKWDR